MPTHDVEPDAPIDLEALRARIIADAPPPAADPADFQLIADEARRAMERGDVVSRGTQLRFRLTGDGVRGNDIPVHSAARLLDALQGAITAVGSSVQKSKHTLATWKTLPEDILRMPGMMAAAVKPAAGSDAQTKMLNFLGREVCAERVAGAGSAAGQRLHQRDHHAAPPGRRAIAGHLVTDEHLHVGAQAALFVDDAEADTRVLAVEIDQQLIHGRAIGLHLGGPGVRPQGRRDANLHAHSNE